MVEYEDRPATLPLAGPESEHGATSHRGVVPHPPSHSTKCSPRWTRPRASRERCALLAERRGDAPRLRFRSRFEWLSFEILRFNLNRVKVYVGGDGSVKL